MRSRVVLPLPLRPERVSRSRRSSLNDTPRKSGSPAMSLPRSDAIATAIAVDARAALAVLGRPFRSQLLGYVAPARDHRRVRRGLAFAVHAAAAGGAEDGDAGDREARVDPGPVAPLAPHVPPHGA